MKKASTTAVSGFSLIEIVVVLAIIGILARFGIPALADLMGSYRLSGAAESLAADLQKVRFRAIAEGYGFRVTFNSGAKTYTVEKETSPNTFAADGAAKKVDDAGVIDVSASANPRFTSRGAVTTPATITLTRTGATKQVLVRQGGRIHVQ